MLLRTYQLLLTIPFTLGWNHVMRINTKTSDPHLALQSRKTMLQQAMILPALLVPQTVSGKNLPDRVTANTSNAGTAEALEPILQLRSSLERALVAVLSNDRTTLDTAVLSIPKQQSAFMSIFDAYSDPVSYKQKFVDQNAFLVYYTKGFDGPGRPNIESDLPIKQTLQYGYRNDAWVAWDDFEAELDFQRKRYRDANSPQYAYNSEDLAIPLRQAIKAIDCYLEASGVGNKARLSPSA